jgi:hypothetical protein
MKSAPIPILEPPDSPKRASGVQLALSCEGTGAKPVRRGGDPGYAVFRNRDFWAALFASRCIGSGPRFCAGPCKYLCSLSLTRFHQSASKIALCFLSLTDTQTCNYLCSLSLTRFHQNAPNIAQCFLSLTDTQTRNYLCFLSLTRNTGEGVTPLERKN